MSSGFNTEFEPLNFSKHLSTANNKESDYDAFKSSFPTTTSIWKFINNQGLVVQWVNGRATWSHEEENTPFYSLPGITKKESVTKLLADKQELEDKISKLEKSHSTLQDEVARNKQNSEALQNRVADLEEQNCDLKAEVQREKDARIILINGINGEKADQKHEELLARFAGLEALEKQILDVTSKLEGRCGAGGGSAVEESWVSTGQTVPSNWVPFEDLDVQTFPKKPTLTITKVKGAPKFRVDNTTNVPVTYFNQGIFPIVVVNVSKLTPNGEEARFDPNIWGSYTNAGVTYAARKLFASEMLDDAHKTS